MKLTWFGGTVLRVHIGGRILVVDPAAVGGVDEAELVSGADRVFRLSDGLPEVDAERWLPRRAPALLDEAELPEVLVHRIGAGAVLVDAVGEPPLVLASGPVAGAGRWGRDSVVVVLGEDLPAVAARALDTIGPRLLVVGGPESVVDAALATIRDRLDGIGFMALEPGMALEV